MNSKVQVLLQTTETVSLGFPTTGLTIDVEAEDAKPDPGRAEAHRYLHPEVLDGEKAGLSDIKLRAGEQTPPTMGNAQQPVRLAALLSLEKLVRERLKLTLPSLHPPCGRAERVNFYFLYLVG